MLFLRFRFFNIFFKLKLFLILLKIYYSETCLKNVVRGNKSRQIALLGSLERSEEYRPNNTMTGRKPTAFRRRGGGAKMRREDDVKRDLRVV